MCHTSRWLSEWCGFILRKIVSYLICILLWSWQTEEQRVNLFLRLNLGGVVCELIIVDGIFGCKRLVFWREVDTIWCKIRICICAQILCSFVRVRVTIWFRCDFMEGEFHTRQFTQAFWYVWIIFVTRSGQILYEMWTTASNLWKINSQKLFNEALHAVGGNLVKCSKLLQFCIYKRKMSLQIFGSDQGHFSQLCRWQNLQSYEWFSELPQCKMCNEMKMMTTC